jgi:hypothetical protein
VPFVSSGRTPIFARTLGTIELVIDQPHIKALLNALLGDPPLTMRQSPGLLECFVNAVDRIADALYLIADALDPA